MLTEVDSLKAVASGRFIFARWFLLFAGILAIGLFSYFNNAHDLVSLSSDGPLIAILFVVGILNILFLMIYNWSLRHNSYAWLSFLNVVQLVIDFVVIFLALILVDDPTGLLPILFFIPIIESLFIFESAVALVVSVLSAGVLVALPYLPPLNISLLEGIVSFNLLPADKIWQVDHLWIIALAYVLFTILMSYFMDIVVSLGLQTVRQPKRASGEMRSPASEAIQAECIRKYSKKLEESNRLLRSKEIELTLANEELEALENAKSEFISVTTHQLRTPLSAIKWTFNMIITEQLGKINEEQKEFLEKGYQSALRMISIVNNLVHIDHATAKKEDYNFVATDLVPLIENVMFEFSNQAESKKIALTFNRPGNKLPPAEIDENKIRMMLENLIDNAIKYTPTGGKITITLADEKLNSAQPAFNISVADSGVGIPQNEQNKIFHKFFRATNARRAEPDGSGIGLYIARDVVVRHQGTMRFESLEGKGTTFFVVLPIHQKDQAGV